MSNSGNEFGPAIHRGRLDKLKIYEISENELDQLEKGSLESIFLNFALAFLPAAISNNVTLWLTNIPESRIYYSLFIVTAVFYVAGFVCLILWLFFRRSLKKVSTEIRNRIPPEGDQVG